MFKNFFKIKKTSVAQVSVAKVSNTSFYQKEVSSYPKEVIEIHKEFDTAGEKLLAEAMEHINKSQSCGIDKTKRLLSLGFKQAHQVTEHSAIIKQAEISKEVAELVKHYQVKYPNNKFITEEQVKEICFKYNLICGEVGKFKGFVPEKNMKQIEDFATRYNIPKQARFVPYKVNEWHEEIISLDDYIISKNSSYVTFSHKVTNRHCFQQNTDRHDGINYYGSAICSDGVKRDGNVTVTGLQICAPVKDMDMTGMTIKDGYKMRQIHIPDPVVLQPIMGGYLILTAWADEASDPLVVNQINN